MEESRISGTPITPLYSFGAYQGQTWKPEIRTGELKGMMRYMYRIACPADDPQLEKR